MKYTIMAFLCFYMSLQCIETPIHILFKEYIGDELTIKTGLAFIGAYTVAVISALPFSAFADLSNESLIPLILVRMPLLFFYAKNYVALVVNVYRLLKQRFDQENSKNIHDSLKLYLL